MRQFLVLLGWILPFAPVQGASKPVEASAEVFGPTKVWTMHLRVTPEDWEKMQPPQRGFAGMGGMGSRTPPRESKGKPRGSFGLEFEYVRGELQIEGETFKDIEVRFKGGGSYVTSTRTLRRPFKIDLDRQVEGQHWQGLKKLTLNNNMLDPTAVREVLSYALYREMQVPAPRTAYVQMKLTVPGKYENVFLGLYTLIESIDKPFLKSHFGSAKGLLLKPERVGPLEYLGEDWKPYEGRYRPKTEASNASKRRFIEFTKLIQRADDQEFYKQIGNYLDLDQFLRFLAVTVTLSTMDSFIGLGHNYYIYLDPKKNKFVLLPWDLDHSLGGFVMMATGDALADLSIRQPQPGRNRLIERILADEKHYEQYKTHLKTIVEKYFTPEKAKHELTAIQKVIGPVKEKEKKAIAERREGAGGFGLGAIFFPQAPDPATFVSKRVVSLQNQLAGKSKGTLVGQRGGMFTPPPSPAETLAKMVLERIDEDKDGLLSRNEALEGAKSLFQVCLEGERRELGTTELTAGLERLLSRPGGLRLFGRRAGPAVPVAGLARGIMQQAGKQSNLSEPEAVALAGKLFDKADKGGRGKLDRKQIEEALRLLLPAAPFEPAPGPARGNAGTTPQKKEGTR